jgi:hypothetical protein
VVGIEDLLHYFLYFCVCLEIIILKVKKEKEVDKEMLSTRDK